jgi:hypothetical protein
MSLRYEQYHQAVDITRSYRHRVIEIVQLPVVWRLVISVQILDLASTLVSVIARS